MANIPLWGSRLLRFLNFSLRWKWIGFDGAEATWTSQPPRIIAFWHGQQMMMPFVYLNINKHDTNHPMTVLSSEHKDGRMMAAILNKLGIKSIFGSSSHGGRAALFGMIRALENGSHIALTPDGPKGPVSQVKEGIIRIAQRAGAPIYPIAISYSSAWKFKKSWDSMLLPLPFSRAVIVMDKPIHVLRKLTVEQIEELRIQLEKALIRVTEQANKAVALKSY